MSFKNAKIIEKSANPEKYHADKVERGKPEFVVSSSSLRSFWYCPSKWKEPIVAADGTITFYEHPATKSTEWGNLFDCYVLTPEQFNDRYIQVPDDAPRKPSSAQRNAKKPSPDTIKAIEWWDDFEDEHGEKTVLSDSDAYNVRRAAMRFLEFPEIGDYIKNCDKQVWLSAEWHDKETGLVIPCKCLIDLVPNLESEKALFDPAFAKTVGDVKTTKNAHPSAWEKWCHTAGYEIQAAWNADMLATVDDREIADFCFLLSENHAPWQPAKRMMSNDLYEKTGDVNEGRAQYERMMADYCRCLKTGKWPGFDDTDESLPGGWTVVRPNPYASQARMFSPKFSFNEEQEEVGEEEPADLIP